VSKITVRRSDPARGQELMLAYQEPHRLAADGATVST